MLCTLTFSTLLTACGGGSSGFTAVPVAPATPPVARAPVSWITALGDSITNGVGTSPGNADPMQLDAMLGVGGSDLGIPGALLPTSVPVRLR